MSERLRKTDGLSLADVVRLKKIAAEQDRQDAMFDAEQPGYILKRPKKTTVSSDTVERRMAATYFWPEVCGVSGSTVEEKAKNLAALKEDFPTHVWQKLLLDLVVDITPLNKPVPDTLIALLQDALGLRPDHEVGGWPLTAGVRDDRGKPDHEARECASQIDREYLDALLTHKDATKRLNAEPMGLNVLRREVKAKLGRAPATKTLREWRRPIDDATFVRPVASLDRR